MINFNTNELRSKIHACWLGKNIGGTIGGPFEGQQKTNDCTGYTSKPGKPLPNDDLDLQLVWLAAMADVGPQKLNSKVLGQYWLEYITPYWNEYGICKANMARGLSAPMCGAYKNHWKHSNGAWIRTEIWATLYPADIENAIRFAYEDACVDHGTGEGTYAAIFVAAMESAAFVIDDIRTLIKIGLSKIPPKSRMYKFITKTVECYDSGKTWKETRDILVEMSLADEELGWFQAPANVSFAILGLLYGEGDFKKSMLTACNCGDDTDCTCATVGSILGIMHGMDIIPQDWADHIGEDIVTISLSLGALHGYQKDFMDNCNTLTDKVMSMHKLTLDKSNITISDEATDLSEVDTEKFMGNKFAMKLENLSDYFLEDESVTAQYIVEYEREPEIEPNGEIKIKLSIINKMISQKAYTVKWILPEGWSVKGKSSLSLMYQFASYYFPEVPTVEEYVITAPDKVDTKNTLVLSVSADGTPDTKLIPVVLFG